MSRYDCVVFFIGGAIGGATGTPNGIPQWNPQYILSGTPKKWNGTPNSLQIFSIGTPNKKIGTPNGTPNQKMEPPTIKNWNPQPNFFLFLFKTHLWYRKGCFNFILSSELVLNCNVFKNIYVKTFLQTLQGCSNVWKIIEMTVHFIIWMWHHYKSKTAIFLSKKHFLV